jgi:hypothetical protein
VNISIKNFNGGTTSDIDGRFQLTLPQKNLELVFSYIGFESRSLLITENKPSLLIRLHEKTTQLAEVIILADNPAFRIIRKATKNKPLNDPENLTSFSYNSYNKLYSTLLNPDTSAFISETEDSARFKRYLRDNHLFIHESYTERKFLKPNFSNEVVLGNHLSGVKDPFFAFLATDLQPFSFYKDFILLFDKNYLNPLSPGSTQKYDFEIVDTIYHTTDSVFVISFEPLPGKVFDGLKGQLYINSDGYAIESVHAQPADDKVLVESLIQQQYEKINGHWFPVQLNSELRFKNFNIQNLKLKYVSHSYLTNIKIDAKLKAEDFALANITFDGLANTQDKVFWDKHRAGEFDKKESHTFNSLDSIGANLKILQAAFKLLEGFYLGRFRAGAFYLPLEYLIQINQYETVRIGFGFQTGEKISKRFVLDCYGGYGFKDIAFKYGAALQVNVSEKKEAYFKFSYKQDLLEPGRPLFIKSAVATRTQESTRNWMASRMDSIEQYRIEFNERPFHYSQLTFFGQQTKRNPTYNYSFINDADNVIRRRFTVFEAGLQWRFAPKETYLKIGQSQVVTGMTYPQINVSLSKSFAGVFDGEYDFTKLEVRADHQFILRGLGKTTFQVASGIMDGVVPYPFLFGGKGSRFEASALNNIVVRNYFQTMGLYEFFSTRYAYLFVNQHVGRITGNKSKFFRPELSLIHNMGIGNLSDKNLHKGVEFKTMSKGYFESGLVLANIIRFNYMDLVYCGIGAGGFYRYGNYSLPDKSENLVVKFVITFSF